MYDNYAGNQLTQAKVDYDIRRQSIAESIAQQLNDAKSNVARLEELNKLIQENPAIERILTLMNR